MLPKYIPDILRMLNLDDFIWIAYNIEWGDFKEIIPEDWTPKIFYNQSKQHIFGLMKDVIARGFRNVQRNPRIQINQEAFQSGKYLFF